MNEPRIYYWLWPLLRIVRDDLGWAYLLPGKIMVRISVRRGR